MPQDTLPRWQKVIGVVAVLFGLLTLFKSGGILFDMGGAKVAAGAYVPFVVQFNFVAGFFYILAGVGIWLGRRWACPLSGLIAASTLLVAAAFAFHVSQGGGFEVKTAGALAVRAGFWAVVAIVLRRTRR
ncbi:MAG: hypothetical protein L3J36_15105 [Rhodobacteraceae bacterium]|nr:hypothetical protein [Paracoccaceae bacterium]